MKAGILYFTLIYPTLHLHYFPILYRALNAEKNENNFFWTLNQKFPRLRPVWVGQKNEGQKWKECMFFDLGPTYFILKAFKTVSTDHFTKEPLKAWNGRKLVGRLY